MLQRRLGWERRPGLAQRAIPPPRGRRTGPAVRCSAAAAAIGPAAGGSDGKHGLDALRQWWRVEAPNRTGEISPHSKQPMSKVWWARSSARCGRTHVLLRAHLAAHRRLVSGGASGCALHCVASTTTTCTVTKSCASQTPLRAAHAHAHAHARIPIGRAPRSSADVLPLRDRHLRGFGVEGDTLPLTGSYGTRPLKRPTPIR